MEINIYAIYDEKTDAFATPFFVTNDDIAIRSIKDVLLSPDHQFHHYPLDFHLYRLGTYFPNTGAIKPVPHREPVCSIMDVKALMKKEQERETRTLSGVDEVLESARKEK